MTDLFRAVTVHAPADVDRIHLARLIKAMCDLNGIQVAIEYHAVNIGDSEDDGSTTTRPGSPDPV